MTTKDDILAACAERVGDITQLLVAADFFQETGDERLSNCLRWMARWEKWPLLILPSEPNRDIYKDPPAWEWTVFGGLCGPRFKCGTNHALPTILCRRMGFREWQLHKSWALAVNQLATALEEGDVECVGDPTKVDEYGQRLIEEQTAETFRHLRELGLIPEWTTGPPTTGLT